MRWKSNEFEVARAICLMQNSKNRNLWFCSLPTYATFSRSITFSFILLLSRTASWRCSPGPANIACYKYIRIDKTVGWYSKFQKFFNRVISIRRSNHKGIYLKRDWISLRRRECSVIRSFVVLCYMHVCIKVWYMHTNLTWITRRGWGDEGLWDIFGVL